MPTLSTDQDTRNIARELNIELRFIPPGWTDELHPLDRYLVGAMKSICRRLCQRFCLRPEDGHVKTRGTIQFLIQAWDGLETRVIEKGRGLSDNVFGEAEDEDEDARDEWEPGADYDSIQ
jgi:hypothetical protein